MLWTGLSPSFCWLASSLTALIKFSRTLRHRLFAPPATCWALSNHNFSPQTAHHQPQCFFPAETRSPPRENCFSWAQVRHSDTSLSSRWRNDASQVVRTLQHNSLYGAQSTRLIFCHLFSGLTYSFEDTFRGPYFDLEDSSHSPLFNAKKPCCIILGVQSVSVQHFHLFQVFFGR